MALTLLMMCMINLVFIQGRTDVENGYFKTPLNQTHLATYSNYLTRAHYNPWTCNYREEPGYSCLSCSAALHCFPANFALLVQCGGLFPHCRNGYCSLFKTEGCNEEYMFAEGTHGPLRVTTPSEATTSSVAEAIATETTEQIPENNNPSTVTTPEFIEDDKNKTNTAETNDEAIEANVVKNQSLL